MDWWKPVWAIVRLYVPPKDGDRDHLVKFQWAQSVGIVGIWFVAWIAAVWLIGKVPFIPKVAWADDVTKVEHKVDVVRKREDRILSDVSSIKLYEMQTQIAQQFRYSCQAQKAKNQTDLDIANSALGNLIYEYEQQSGGKPPPNMPSNCSTILVDGN